MRVDVELVGALGKLSCLPSCLPAFLPASYNSPPLGDHHVTQFNDMLAAFEAFEAGYNSFWLDGDKPGIDNIHARHGWLSARDEFDNIPGASRNRRNNKQ